MKKTYLCLAVMLLLALCTASLAGAALSTHKVDFVAGNFIDLFGSVPAPTDPVVGSFLITFDPLQSYNNGTTISNFSMNIALDSPPAFFYTALVPDQLAVFGHVAITAGTNDFGLVIHNWTTVPTMFEFIYAQSPFPSSIWKSATGSVTVTTPLPSALLLFGTGLAGLVGLRRKS